MNAAMRMKNLPKTDNDTMSTLSRTMKDKDKRGMERPSGSSENKKLGDKGRWTL
jgi:hypothetical protein